MTTFNPTRRKLLKASAAAGGAVAAGVQGGGECGVSPEKFPGGRPVYAETAAEM